jgi:transcriptional regulator with XRE-family HTH domain
METLMSVEPAIGEMLKARRKELGLTLAELAERTGMSVNGISKIETGNQTNPSWETVVTLCKSLGVTPDYFYLPEPSEGEAEATEEPTPAKPISKRK